MTNIDAELFDSNEPIDRLDELISLLIDEEIGPRQHEELQHALLASDEARRRYVGMMQLHVDLLEHFQPTSPTDKPKSPVLGFLADVHPPLPGMPGRVEE